MELSDTVHLFATEEFADVFDTDVTFNGKIAPFAEVANSGSSSQRRILETSPDITIPTGKVIQAFTGEKFIVAEANADYWFGETIRNKYPVLPVVSMGAVGNVGSTISSTQSDLLVYAYPFFTRREPDVEERSDHFSGFEIYFSSAKSFSRGDILTLGSAYYRLRTDTSVDGAGFSVAQAVKLENPLQTFDVDVTGIYDTVNDNYTPTTTADVSCFVEALSLDYEFVSPSFTDIEVGDKAISLLNSAVTVKINSRIGDYRVQSIRNHGTWSTCQCRNLS